WANYAKYSYSHLLNLGEVKTEDE
ncbi:MAG: hypothetical protein RL690_1025, partial [Actinomycetota bacterium]